MGDSRAQSAQEAQSGPAVRHTQCSTSSAATLLSSCSESSMASTSGEEDRGWTGRPQASDSASQAGGQEKEQRVDHNTTCFPTTGSRRTSSSSCLRRRTTRERDGDNDSQSSFGSSFVTLSAEEKEWMLVSSTADYQEMFRLLMKNGSLANVKNISNTALHWAAKLGKPEVVKMLANKIGVNVNQRSGYTPLHLAAIHGHNHVIELLISVYNADPNIRDYSGKKPRQYQANLAALRTVEPHVMCYTTANQWDVIITPSAGYRTNRDSRSNSVLHQCSLQAEEEPETMDGEWVLLECDDDFGV